MGYKIPNDARFNRNSASTPAELGLRIGFPEQEDRTGEPFNGLGGDAADSESPRAPTAYGT